MQTRKYQVVGAGALILATAIGSRSLSQCYRPRVQYYWNVPEPVYVGPPNPYDEVEPVPEPPIPVAPPPRPAPNSWHFGKRVRLPVIRQIPANSHSDWDDDCGQYVIATLLSALGHEIDVAAYDRIGRAVNPDQDGVAASSMISFLKPYVRSVEYSSADFDHVRAQLDRGLPAVLAVKTPTTAHWVLLVGYTTNGKGQYQSWDIVDNGVLNGTISHQQLKPMWDSYDNVCILVEPIGRYPVDLDRSVVQFDPKPAPPTPPPAPPEPPRPTPPEPIVHASPSPVPDPPVEPVSQRSAEPITVSAVERRDDFAELEEEELTNAASADSVAAERAISMSTIEDLMPPGSFTRVLFAVVAVAIPLCLLYQLLRGRPQAGRVALEP